MNYPHLAEQAILEFLKRQTLETLTQDANAQRNIYKASDSPDGGWLGSQTKVKKPFVMIECAEATPYAQPAGNEQCEMILYVVTQRDDESDGTHRARCAEIFGLFRTDNIADLLSDHNGFTCEFMIIRDETSMTRTGRHLESTLRFTMFCAALDIATA